jgi:surface protein
VPNGGLSNTEISSIFSPSTSDTVVEVNWGNGQNYVYNNIGILKGVIVPTYSDITSPYTIRITKQSGSGNIDFRTASFSGNTSYGSFDRPYRNPFANGLRSILRFGSNIRLGNTGYHFRGCVNLTNVSQIDTPQNPLDNSYAGMFEGCRLLIGSNLSSWNTNSITDMQRLFNNSPGVAGFASTNTSLTFDLRAWNLSNVTNMTSMLSNTDYLSLDPGAYSNLLLYLASNNFNSGVRLDAGTNKYYNQQSITNARSELIGRGWIIVDGGAI